MLEPIFKEATKITPEVKLDKENEVFEITGRSLPEDVIKFYSDIRTWIKSYCQDPNPSTIFKFQLDYFNSSSARLLVKILIDLETILQSGKNIKVIWYYQADDDVIKSRGYEIKSVVLLPFEVRPLEN
ncbi:MAG: DUF1987 domain-containing protein [Bacteroidales bacterium]|nr:DUF1987 domain-containing protein [Bacteroidales bacterium]